MTDTRLERVVEADKVFSLALNDSNKKWIEAVFGASEATKCVLSQGLDPYIFSRRLEGFPEDLLEFLTEVIGKTGYVLCDFRSSTIDPHQYQRSIEEANELDYQYAVTCSIESETEIKPCTTDADIFNYERAVEDTLNQLKRSQHVGQKSRQSVTIDELKEGESSAAMDMCEAISSVRRLFIFLTTQFGTQCYFVLWHSFLANFYSTAKEWGVKLSPLGEDFIKFTEAADKFYGGEISGRTLWEITNTINNRIAQIDDLVELKPIEKPKRNAARKDLPLVNGQHISSRGLEQFLKRFQDLHGFFHEMLGGEEPFLQGFFPCEEEPMALGSQLDINWD